jgi:hypothetical protein
MKISKWLIAVLAAVVFVSGSAWAGEGCCKAKKEANECQKEDKDKKCDKCTKDKKCDACSDKEKKCEKKAEEKPTAK